MYISLPGDIETVPSPSPVFSALQCFADGFHLHVRAVADFLRSLSAAFQAGVGESLVLRGSCRVLLQPIRAAGANFGADFRGSGPTEYFQIQMVRRLGCAPGPLERSHRVAAR
jgi:hypothetical protein